MKKHIVIIIFVVTAFFSTDLMAHFNVKGEHSKKKNYTHISVILDRTGSMESIRDDTIGGFNTFLKGLKDQTGTVTLTLAQFDSQDPYEIIHRFEQIGNISELTLKTYVPRASTPLLDALGRGINDLEKSLAELKEKDQPSGVMMVVITDGRENASREFRKNQIEKMIKERTDKDNWQFVFLSADLEAINDATSIGIDKKAILHYQKSKKGTSRAWKSLSNAAEDYCKEPAKKVDLQKENPKIPKE